MIYFFRFILSTIEELSKENHAHFNTTFLIKEKDTKILNRY